MRESVKRILLTLLALVLLAGFAVAVPSPAIRPEAEAAYWTESAADDEYSFLFE